MERVPLLPSIQAVNSGTEMSYKVQYAPVYTGRAKSRPLSAYEEEILKRALRSRDDDSSTIIVPADVTSAAEVELGSAKLAPQKLLSKRQLQAQPAMIGNGNSMGSTSSTNSNATMTGGGNSAALSRQRESARYNGDYEHATAFKGASLIENLTEEFNENDLRCLKRSSSHKQKLRKMEASGALLQHLSASAPLQQVAAAAATTTEAAPPLHKALKPLTLKEQAAELRRYQRRVIYMLNRVMTEAEARQFDQFIQLKGLRAKEHRLA